MDFYILKFVKLLIKFPPKLSLAHLSPTVDRDRRCCSHAVMRLTGNNATNIMTLHDYVVFVYTVNVVLFDLDCRKLLIMYVQ